jgi:aryl-alcohol dehydrogenase-like predicted oxidoreductase
VKVGLGTVQFGLSYGVSNSEGQTPLEEVVEIVRFAASEGVRVLDTSPSYGVSEKVLGIALKDAGKDASQMLVVTKTRPDLKSPRQLREDLDGSLRNLQRPFVYGLLVHRSGDLLAAAGDELYAELNRLKDQGLVKKIGVSVYDAAEIDQVLNRFPVDLVQVPVSVMDQRLVASGHLRRMKDRDIEIHARSVFLQGLLLLEPENLRPSLKPLEAALRSFRSFAAERGLTPLEGALDFIAQIAEIDVAICGVNTLGQLRGIVRALPARIETEGWGTLSANEEQFLNPAAWV